MSLASSPTGLSSASSFLPSIEEPGAHHHACFYKTTYFCLIHCYGLVMRGSTDLQWICYSLEKKTMGEERVKKKNPAAVKICPWTLASLNAEEISKAAAEAREQSKILQPVIRREAAGGLKRDSSFGSGGRQMFPRPDSSKRRSSKQVRLPAHIPMEPVTKVSTLKAKKGSTETSIASTPLQLEARSAFQTSRALSSSTANVASSPESSLDSLDIHPLRISLPGAEESRRLTSLSVAGSLNGITFSRSTSYGYEASGGEDSDRVPFGIVQRSNNWTNLVFRPDRDEGVIRLKASPSSSRVKH